MCYIILLLANELVLVKFIHSENMRETEIEMESEEGEKKEAQRKRERQGER